MANFTKKAIKETFINLLIKKPLSEITVSGIAKECGINRNTFYYHYDDIPAIIEEIVMQEFANIISEHQTIDSIEDGLNAIYYFASNNKKALLHIYNSVNRNIFEDYLWRLGHKIIESFTSTILKDRQISKNDERLFETILCAFAVGVVLDWINTGMRDNADEDIHRICDVANGTIERILMRCENNCVPNDERD